MGFLAAIPAALAATGGGAAAAGAGAAGASAAAAGTAAAGITAAEAAAAGAAGAASAGAGAAGAAGAGAGLTTGALAGMDSLGAGASSGSGLSAASLAGVDSSSMLSGIPLSSVMSKTTAIPGEESLPILKQFKQGADLGSTLKSLLGGNASAKQPSMQTQSPSTGQAKSADQLLSEVMGGGAGGGTYQYAPTASRFVRKQV